MIEFLNEEKIKLFRNKISLFLSYILPGIVVLEVFFNRGIFSNVPDNLYSFIFTILWSFVFSLPYNLIDTVDIKQLVIDVIKYKHTKENYNIDGLDNLESLKENIPISEDDLSNINFAFIIIYCFLTYIIYKYLTSHYIYISFWNINNSIIIFLNTLFIIYLFFYPILRFISSAIIKRYIYKHIK